MQQLSSPAQAARPPVASRPALLLAVAALVALFAAQALAFAAAQDIWTDESTQLAGVALPLGRLFRWLAGAPDAFGVPGDRMPPVSYLLDKGCAATLCRTAFGLRVLHVLVAAAGLWLLLDMVARRYGLLAVAAAGLFLALSSNLVSTAPELRAYPLFFAGACLEVRLFAKLVDAPDLPQHLLVAFAAAGLLTIYTHFFGLVCVSALFVGLAAARVRDRRSAVRIGVTWALVMVASLGLVPFVIGARSQSDAAPLVMDAQDIGMALLRMTGFPTMLIQPWMAIAFFGGLALVLAVLAWRIVPRSRDALVRPWPVARALALALVVGLAVTIAAAFVARGFDPMKSGYSIWTLPVLAVLVGAACCRAEAREPGWRLALGGAALLLVGTAGGQWMMLSHPRWFTHGVAREIVGQFTTTPDRIAIVYEGDFWSAGEFALNYLYGNRLRQWRLDPAGVPRRLPIRLDEALPPGGPAEARPPVDVVILASVSAKTYRELRELDHGLLPADLLQPLDSAPGWLGPGWSAGNEIRIPGNYWLRMISFHRSAGR